MDKQNLTPINIVYPEIYGLHDMQGLHLRIRVGACRLNIRPGEGDEWVTGTYSDPTGAIPVHVARDGDIVSIELGRNVLDAFEMVSGIPRLDLTLGKTHTYALTIEVGAGENQLELGGLPIRRLMITYGAGKTDVNFATPNPEGMSLLKLGIGAGAIEARNLANANFAEMSVEGGTGSFKLNFGGRLLQSAYVHVGTALSSVEIDLPPTTAAKITSGNLIGVPDADTGFIQQEQACWTRSALEGSTPLLRIHTAVALGKVNLRSLTPELVGATH